MVATYGADAIQSVLTLATELIALQAVGAAINLSELSFLCQNFIPNGSTRLQAQGYDVNLIKTQLCAGAAGTTLPPLDQISTLTAQISSAIWIVQAIGAVTGQGGVQNLCNLINVAAANAIGLQGDLVKKNVCAAAVVANQVSSTNKPASFTLKLPVVVAIAPVAQVVLPFVPVAAASKDKY